MYLGKLTESLLIASAMILLFYYAYGHLLGKKLHKLKELEGKNLLLGGAALTQHFRFMGFIALFFAFLLMPMLVLVWIL